MTTREAHDLVFGSPQYTGLCQPSSLEAGAAKLLSGAPSIPRLTALDDPGEVGNAAANATLEWQVFEGTGEIEEFACIQSYLGVSAGN